MWHSAVWVILTRTSFFWGGATITCEEREELEITQQAKPTRVNKAGCETPKSYRFAFSRVQLTLAGKSWKMAWQASGSEV